MKRKATLIDGLFCLLISFGLFSVFFFGPPGTIADPQKILQKKPQELINLIQTANSLEEIHTGFVKANLSQSELNQLIKEIESRPALKQKLDGLAKQEATSIQTRLDQYQREGLARVGLLKSQYGASLPVARRSKFEPEPCPPSATPVIDKIDGEPIVPGARFVVKGKGFGPGSAAKGTACHIELTLGTLQPPCPVFIQEWTDCYVTGYIAGNIQGVKATEAMLGLWTAQGKESHKATRFQPLMEIRCLTDSESLQSAKRFIGLALAVPVVLGDSQDWTKNDFNLKNDWFVKERIFRVDEKWGHAERTYESDVNVPNGSARTVVHAGCDAFGYAVWTLFTVISGPAGLPFR